MTTTTKLDRLTMLRDTLIDIKRDCAKDADEWNTYNDMLGRVHDLLTEERRKRGWMAVYPIVDGSARESLFEGDKEQCKIYTDILLQAHPEMKGNIIVLEL